ncbi:decaprenyl-phosphate phosphoribosyltransferase [Amycolatopsis roodepoortensis]|uniref:Decaprenyl-phosphate phosphoribosyltransferase n=1 Tax=Amycolatopsis keratiniphila subsp. keratiniphila TaxID=227715 RepID=A0A1W2LRU7_9PSEU|nr:MULTISPECIES: decaprenyl-phosphate phosphoribosyltransferase [Amycolatopsis]OLZ59679.1 decaprenyl-phosphate phosphoribosyltransferase [Amycolatopsis keratiniphila subsp. nogabecina]ONF66846.1 decaprenyl-phosphate phosphoribosyltransferase [Amycolatopsis keratiniphila subsp. keratiniphila]UUV28412.1 decaprenyl-phosphate phosphoribosyltransferase [Amycolatopsis roodepoortensis]SDU54708.1 decaprenyl-phosphate phosphoribosyltransferase [Amycolatopsis keratiniphila]
MSETTEKADSKPDDVEPVAEAAEPKKVAGGLVGGIIKTARPRQWVKNVLVFAAPFFAFSKSTDRTGLLIAALIAFAAFSLVASSVYLINDAIDVEADRAHPTKRNRPIAAGIVPVPVAFVAAAVFFAAGLGISFFASWQLAVVLAVYEAVQLGYCFGLKHQPVVDLAIVGSGFLMRSIAGGVAAGIALSQWFLLVTAFGSLFMVAGKRYAEIMLFERTGAKIRSSLKKYSASYLRFVWATSAAILIMSYCLWAFEIRQVEHDSVWAVVSMVPFVVAVLRYAVDVDGGNAGEPEEIALKDRVLQVLGASWVITLFLSFYL